METITQVAPEILDFLRRTDTCTVSNAIETFNVRMRNEGFTQRGIKCMFPGMPRVAGYAVTGRIRTAAPPLAKLCYYQNIEWWQYVAGMPGPKIVVVADMYPAPGLGAFFGEIHAQISKALGCVAYVSNGTVRDLPAMQAANFQCFATGVSISHSYAHLIEMGEPVEVGSLHIRSGDLLHADCHGVQTIPIETAAELPGVVSDIENRERELIRLCTQTDFSIETLVTALRYGNEHFPSLPR